MVSPWRVLDAGTRDPMSAAGFAAPSWGNFTQRVWVREVGNFRQRLVLRNMSNDWGFRVPFRGSEYQVRLFDEENTLVLILTGTDWQDLVRKAKQWSYEEYP